MPFMNFSLVLCKAKRCLWWPHLNVQEFKFGRWTFICQWTPQYQTRNALGVQIWQMNLHLPMDPPGTRAEMPWIPVHKTWQMNLLWLMDLPGTRAEMPWIPVHKTWQMNLLWLMDPLYQSRDAMNTTTQNLADEPILANDPPVPEQRWLAYHYTKLGRWTYFGWWLPKYQSRDDLHTTTQNLADEPILANGPPSTRAEMTWIPLQRTWQMNLIWLMDPQY